MFSNKLLNKINLYYPIDIKFKNNNLLMKILDKLLFFTKNFMTEYTTTIGNTIYFPNKTFIDVHPVSSLVILLHELIHISDSNKITKYLFGFLYLCPQILFIPSLLLFLISWKIALPVIILFLLPLPAYFRMLFEKRAYMTSLYVMHKLNIKYNYNIDLKAQKDFFVEQFKKSYYYFMWIFNDIDRDFNDALPKILNGDRPFNDKIFDMIDDILSEAI